MYETYRAAIAEQGFEGVELRGCPSLVNGIRRDISGGKGQVKFKGDR